MRVRLYEAEPIDVVSKTPTNYHYLSNEEKEAFVSSYIMKHDNLKNIGDAVKHSFDVFGINKNSNTFLSYFDTLPFKPTADMNQNFITLIDMEDKNKIANLGSEYLTKESLFDRSNKDFQYTVNACEIAQDKDRLSKYIDNVTDISIKDLYDDSGNVKPAGGPDTADNINTIYGMIEYWGKENGTVDSKEISNKQNKKDLYTINDVIKRKRETDDDFAISLVSQMKARRLSGAITNIYEPIINDIDYYIDKFSTIMGIQKNKSVPTLTTSELEKIKRNKVYSLDEIKNPKEGQIVFAIAKYDWSEHPERGGIDDSFLGEGTGDFCIYLNKHWYLYDDVRNDTKKKINSKLKTMFMSIKCITNPGDDIAIIAGVLSALDQIKTL